MKRFALPVTIVAALALAPGSALGATILVDDDGVQCPTATFTSINNASAAALPGDTIKVCAGTYSDTVNVSKPLTFAGAQAGKDARHDRDKDAKESIVNAPNGGFSLSSSANDVSIDGFTIRGAAGGHKGIEAFQGSTGLTVVNDVIENNDGGVSFGNPASSSDDAAVFRHNRIDNNDNNPAENETGIFACCTPANYVLIEENLFENHNGDIASASNNTDPADGYWLIRNNDSIDDDSFFVVKSASNTAVVDNDITKKDNKGPGQSGSAILIGGDNNGILVQDNKIKDGDASGIRVQNLFGSPDLNIFIRSNDVDKRLNGIRVGGGESGVTLEANKATNSTNFDCLDETTGTGTAGTANTWTNDKGKKASPAGICTK